MITNPIVYLSTSSSDILKKRLIEYSSRYNKSSLLYYSDLSILTFETYDKRITGKIKKNIEDIKYYVITPGVEYKPWLASYQFYSDAGYWWMLMEFNDFFDIEEFYVGRTIKVPPMTAFSSILG